ncbi:MAG: hypothetical protein F6K00_31505 [Leptolyngbya sp. SIOISBB]|nr:hypothetical protein [Leptolyngbya sp. SIOISBB]
MSDSLSPRKRLELIRLVSALSVPEFEELLFALRPKAGVVPPNVTAQGNRAKALLEWVEGPTGCGLKDFLQVLDEFMPSRFPMDFYYSNQSPSSSSSTQLFSEDTLKSEPETSFHSSLGEGNSLQANDNSGIINQINQVGNVTIDQKDNSHQQINNANVINQHFNNYKEKPLLVLLISISLVASGAMAYLAWFNSNDVGGDDGYILPTFSGKATLDQGTFYVPTVGSSSVNPTVNFDASSSGDEAYVYSEY